MAENKVDAALKLAARGFRVFPLVANGKLPAVKGWKELATTDEAVIRRVWSGGDYNIGVVMGGGLLGFDIDTKDGKNGKASAIALGLTEVRGFVVRTPTGGLHAYYRAPDVGNSAGRLGDGLDVRSVGGFLVGPGSVIDGRAYEIVNDNDPEPVPPVIIHRLAAAPERKDFAVDVHADQPENVARAIEWLRTAAPTAIEGGHGDETTYRVAARLKDLGVGQDMAADLMAEHWLPRCSHSFAPEAAAEWVKTKIANAYEYGTLPLGAATPAADFAGVSVEPPPQPERPRSQWYRHGDGFDANVSWLFYEMLPTTGVCLLSAPPQAGKTFFCIELARCGATGNAFFTVEPDDRFGTLFVFTGTEGSGLAQRMAALEEPESLPISATQCGNLGERGALDALLADLKEEAAYIEMTFGVPVKLIVFETLAASGLLQDENDNVQAAQAIRNLGQISLAMNALVLTSHHPSKDGKSARGASAFLGNADYVLEIDRRDTEAVRSVRLSKARGAEQRGLGTFSLVPVTLGEDARGRPIKSMRISMGERSSNATRAAPHAEKLIEALQWALMEDGVPLAAGQGVAEDVLREAFRDRLEGSYRTDRSNGNRAFRTAMVWCEQIGRIEVVPHAGQKFIIQRGVFSDAA